MIDIKKKFAHYKEAFYQSLPGKMTNTFIEIQGTDDAAMLSYYSILSFFPLVLASLSILNLLGLSEVILEFIMPLLQSSLPPETLPLIMEPLRRFSNFGGAQLTLIIAIVTALWASTKYLAGFGRVIDGIFKNETPGTILMRLKMFVLTLALIALIGVLSVLGILGENVSGYLVSNFPFLKNFLAVVSFLRLPAILLFLALLIALLYLVVPSNFLNKKTKRQRFIPGALLAIFLIFIFSQGLQYYVSFSSNFDTVYGTLAGVIIALLWFWLINIGLIIGAILNAVLSSSRT
ncbi:MAG: YihY/virulence factor BrkB family protein [Coriobacteriia bacterium]|nr:YihY/virulence factor BrkB family protein [Coriobacteriia bacterium]